MNLLRYVHRRGKQKYFSLLFYRTDRLLNHAATYIVYFAPYVGFIFLPLVLDILFPIVSDTKTILQYRFDLIHLHEQAHP